MLLSDHIFSPALRYEAHQMIYTKAGDEPIVLTGVLGAAVLAALLVDTDEGNARGIAIDTDDERQAWIVQYEREVRRDDWGYLHAEVEQLSDSYVQLASGEVQLSDICPNIRLHDLALQLLDMYMNHLVRETFGAHIWEAVPWRMPFAQWLWDASQVEGRRQTFLHTDWTHAPQVYALAEAIDEDSSRSWTFEGEQAAELMEQYVQWLDEQYALMKGELPGTKITQADRNFIFKQESDWAFLSEAVASLDSSAQKEWQQWKDAWTKYIQVRLKPQQDIRFWEDEVPEHVQSRMLDYLREQESKKNHFYALTATIYALRQTGYIRRKLTDSAMRTWLSDHLTIDYTLRPNASQFQRAMKEHGRYTPEVRKAAFYLKALGFPPLNS